MELLRLRGLKRTVTSFLIIVGIAMIYILIIAKNENNSQVVLKMKPEVIQIQQEIDDFSSSTNIPRSGSILKKTNRLQAKQQKPTSKKNLSKVQVSGDEWIYMSVPVNETQYTEIAKEEAAKCEEINELIKDRDGIFLQEPPIIDILKAANASLSKVRLDKPGSDIVPGSHFTATVTLYDGYGNRLKRGGDMVRARMNSTSLGAYSVGRVMDNTDGTYTVNFTASWVGNVELQFSLAYPKEAVRGLYFQGQRDLFEMSEYYTQDGNQTEFTPCVKERAELHRIRHLGYKSICPYNNEALFCGKPWHMGCANRKRIAKPDHSVYTKAEYNLLMKRNWNLHLPKTLHVTIIGKNTNETVSSEQRCTSYNIKNLWNFDQPTGFFFRDKWTSNHCYGGPDTREQLVSCLRNTRVYMFGDSTMHQWYTFLQPVLKCSNVTKFESNVKDGLEAKSCVDQNRDFFLAFIPHDRDLWMPNSKPHLSTYLDRIPASQEKSIILIHMFAHFVIRHASLIHTRMHMARISIEKLLKRRPNSIVVIKGPHSFQTRCSSDKCRFTICDYFAEYFRTIIQMEFKHLSNKIIFLNMLDMSSALELRDVHPDNDFIEKSIKYMLGFICQ